jgi:hypothetical protein
MDEFGRFVMAKRKQDAHQLLRRAIESLALAVELFNRPSDVARSHAVLITLHHSFEMMLKATILRRTGTIHRDSGGYSYGFEKCLAVAAELKILDSDERASLTILDAQRDTAVHYYANVSEELLYVHVQAGVTLFGKLLKSMFGKTLAEHLPNRVLPVSAHPPTALEILLDRELTEVDELLGQGKRRGSQAAAKLRSILPFATASRMDAERVTEKDLTRAVSLRRRGMEWSVIFPEIAQLRLATEGTGIPLTLRITKVGEIPVRIANPGETPVGMVVRQEINIWDKFNLGLSDIADKLGVSAPRTHALIYELSVQEDPECYRVLNRKKSIFKGYSKKALDLLRDAIASGVDLDAIWARHRHRFGALRREAPLPKMAAGAK